MRTNGVDASLSFSLYQSERKLAGLTPQDGFVVSYDPMYAESIGKGDALKLNNMDETIGINYHDTTLGIYTKDQLLVADTLQIDIKQMKKKDYTLFINPDNIAKSGLQAYLIDRYENLTQAISLLDTSSYNFSITSDSASFKNNRLFIVFKTTNTTTTTGIEAIKNASVALQSNPILNNQLIWNVSQLPSALYTVKITNALGQELFSKNLDYNGDAQIKVSIPDLAPGIYNASLNSNSKHFNSKILITN
jgi:hypothetical protein